MVGLLLDALGRLAGGQKFMPVRTGTVAGRRPVRYRDLQELLVDAEALAVSGHRTLGNWSYGQILKHLALTCDMSIDGVPFRSPWPLRLAVRPLRRRMLLRAIPAGVRLPGRAAAVLVPAETSVKEGLAELRRGLRRLERESRRSPHPVLGRLTLEDWNLLHLRHAEMHMSFVHPQA